MKVVEIAIRSADSGEVAYGVVAVQRNEGARWHTVKVFPIKSSMPESRRVLLLEDNERVVVEGKSNIEMVYDASQSAMVPKKIEVTDEKVESLAAPMLNEGPPPGPLPEGDESEIGVWRDHGYEADWSRTGPRYRIY